MAKIVVIGIGVVGTAVADYMENFDNEVIKHDIRPGDGIETDIKKCLGDEDLIFVCVPTPSSDDCSVDLSYVSNVTHNIAQTARDKKYSPNIVYKSTMIPGSTAKMVDILEMYGLNSKVAYNPEFLRQKHAFEDMWAPSRIVVGSSNNVFGEKVMSLYDGTNCPKFIFETYEEAELLKYYANTYYAARISYFNQMKRFADYFGCDHDKIVKAIVVDKMVGEHGSNPTGQPYANACLPKDIAAIISCGRSNGIDVRLLEDVVRINKQMINEKINSKIEKWVN